VTGHITPKPGDFIWLVCFDDAGAQREQDLFQFDPGLPLGPNIPGGVPVVTGQQVAQQALATVDLPDPTIATSPPVGTAQLVGFPTWLWLTGPWAQRDATATLAGTSATVSATPFAATWTFGDQSAALTCPGPGTAWDPSHPDTSSTCTHTWTTRSTAADPDGTFPLTATVSYHVAWTATDGESGQLPDLTRTSTIAVTVHEAQAVIH
jgi:hypothetical protein